MWLVYVHSCACPVGMTGDLCDELEDKCLSNPCQNGGTCVGRLTGYQCTCQYPWSGSHCSENTDPCFFNPCLHFGTCYQDPQMSLGFRCECASGFIGM